MKTHTHIICNHNTNTHTQYTNILQTHTQYTIILQTHIQYAFVLFSKFYDFDGPSFNCHISGYNRCRNIKLGLMELYGNTLLHTERTIYLTRPSLRYSR